MSKVALILLGVVVAAYGHGRFTKPISRSSVWRDPEYAHLNPPPNWNDNELYCGAIHQVDDPGTNCGVCGDPLASPAPRDNEIGGTYDAGIITGRYTAGQEIDVEVYLSAAHLGHMEWRLCTDPQNENQECFNRHVLQLADGSGTKFPAGPPGMQYSRVKLPAGVTCERCIIQWNYRAGNTWGECEDGSHANGCGPQETFRGCADVTIS